MVDWFVRHREDSQKNDRCTHCVPVRLTSADGRQLVTLVDAGWILSIWMYGSNLAYTGVAVKP